MIIFTDIKSELFLSTLPFLHLYIVQAWLYSMFREVKQVSITKRTWTEWESNPTAFSMACFVAADVTITLRKTRQFWTETVVVSLKKKCNNSITCLHKILNSPLLWPTVGLPAATAKPFSAMAKRRGYQSIPCFYYSTLSVTDRGRMGSNLYLQDVKKKRTKKTFGLWLF